MVNLLNYLNSINASNKIDIDRKSKFHCYSKKVSIEAGMKPTIKKFQES